MYLMIQIDRRVVSIAKSTMKSMINRVCFGDVSMHGSRSNPIYESYPPIKTGIKESFLSANQIRFRTVMVDRI